GEIDVLAQAMGLTFPVDVVETNLRILDDLTPEASTSMQRDIQKGKASEIDGLIYEVVRMGQRCGVRLPVYERIAGALQERGLS
ncbi:MAG: 2-dehydropantoate 2-reductase, partial [Lachnospiraceae bacterium]|nr:2-dehydropantoate 2-reductase [Lachnospiraceae bacterium]